jgi:RNA-directed DNA polymerase
VAETTADQNAYGVRPQRRGADALDQGFKVRRQKSAAPWILEGAIQGFVDHIRFS